MSRKSIPSTQKKKILELNSAQQHPSPSNATSLFLKILAHRCQVWTTRNHRMTRKGPDLSLVMEIQLEPQAQKDWPCHYHHLTSIAVWTAEGRGSHQLTNSFTSLKPANNLRSPDTSWFTSDDTDREISAHQRHLPSPDLFQGQRAHPSPCHKATSFACIHWC